MPWLGKQDCSSPKRHLNPCPPDRERLPPLHDLHSPALCIALYSALLDAALLDASQPPYSSCHPGRLSHRRCLRHDGRNASAALWYKLLGATRATAF